MINRSGSRTRMLKGFGANGLSQCISLLSQILVTPLLLYVWGIDRYGEWLVLSCLPTYISLSNAGISWAAANEIAMRAARNDHDGANAAFQSTVVMLWIIGLLIFLATACVFVFAPLAQWLSISTISENELLAIGCLLAIAVVVNQQQGLWMSTFRCDGFFAFGSMLGCAFNLVDLIVALTFPFFDSFIVMVSAICGVRILIFVITRKIVFDCFPWLERGYQRVDYGFMNRMWRPGLAHLGYPIGNAMTVQGTIMMIGHTLGPAAVVAFSAHRALLNATTQLMAAINVVIWPEFTTAYGEGNIDQCRRLHRRSSNLSIWLALSSVACLGCTAYWVIPFWTLGKVEMSLPLLIAFSLMIITRTFWYTSSTVASSTNQHEFASFVYTVSSLITLIMIVIALRYESLVAIALFLVVSEISMCFAVIPQSIKITQDNFSDFVVHVVVPPVEDFMHVLRFALRKIHRWLFGEVV